MNLGRCLPTRESNWTSRAVCLYFSSLILSASCDVMPIATPSLPLPFVHRSNASDRQRPQRHQPISEFLGALHPSHRILGRLHRELVLRSQLGGQPLSGRSEI